MKNPLVLFFAAVVIATGITGCGKSSDSQVSTPAEHEAFKARKPTPEEFATAMARAKNAPHGPPQGAPNAPQQPK